MANRVVMDSSGLKISKPGVNVLTANQDGLMFDSSTKMLQVIGAGVRSGSATTFTVTYPNIGIVPFIWMWSPNATYFMTSITSTSATFARQTGGSGTVYYIVLNVPMVP